MVPVVAMLKQGVCVSYRILLLVPARALLCFAYISQYPSAS